MQLADEKIFQQDIINHLVSKGWKLGASDAYDRKHALYPEDLVGYLSDTQPDQWDKFSRMHPKGAEEALLKSVERGGGLCLGLLR